MSGGAGLAILRHGFRRTGGRPFDNGSRSPDRVSAGSGPLRRHRFALSRWRIAEVGAEYRERRLPPSGPDAGTASGSTEPLVAVLRGRPSGSRADRGGQQHRFAYTATQQGASGQHTGGPGFGAVGLGNSPTGVCTPNAGAGRREPGGAPGLAPCGGGCRVGTEQQVIRGHDRGMQPTERAS